MEANRNVRIKLHCLTNTKQKLLEREHDGFHDELSDTYNFSPRSEGFGKFWYGTYEGKKLVLHIVDSQYSGRTTIVDLDKIEMGKGEVEMASTEDALVNYLSESRVVARIMNVPTPSIGWKIWTRIISGAEPRKRMSPITWMRIFLHERDGRKVHFLAKQKHLTLSTIS